MAEIEKWGICKKCEGKICFSTGLWYHYPLLKNHKAMPQKVIHCH